MGAPEPLDHSTAAAPEGPPRGPRRVPRRASADRRQAWVEPGAALKTILATRRAITPQRAILVAVTGIDGCGKGYCTGRIVEGLEAAGVRACPLNIDGWLNLPHLRFDPTNPAEHFYRYAIRFEEMFARLVLPLRDRRSIRLEAEYAEEMATEYRRHVYDYDDIDVLVLEGIYLLKPAFRRHYDLSMWIECGFDTALERAIARRQEGLSIEETVLAYRTIYFPAQEIHFARDNPAKAATVIVNNDPRLGPVLWDLTNRELRSPARSSAPRSPRTLLPVGEADRDRHRTSRPPLRPSPPV